MKPTEVTSLNVSAHVGHDGIAILDFWAGWCAPCRAFAPVFDAAAEKNPDIRFGKVNTETEPKLAAEFDIVSIPTLVVFRDGIPVYAQPGALHAAMFDKLIAQIRALDMNALRRRLMEREATAR